MYLKSIGKADTVLFPTIGKAEVSLLPYIGKTRYLSQKSLGKLAANFKINWSVFPAFKYSDKNFLPTYLNF
jgi:hypothetical protein